MTGMSELHLQILQRAAQAARQGGSGHQASRRFPTAKRSRPRPRACTATRSRPAAAASSAKCTSACSPSRAGTDPEEFCTKARFPSMKDFHFDPKQQLPLGQFRRRRHDPQQLPAGDREGLQGAASTRGVIAGYTVQNVGVEVHFGKHHDVDSSEAAFKTAGSMAFRNVFQEAKPCLLEPIVKIHITVPARKAGRHQQRHVHPPRPRAGHRLGRRQPA